MASCCLRVRLGGHQSRAPPLQHHVSSSTRFVVRTSSSISFPFSSTQRRNRLPLLSSSGDSPLYDDTSNGGGTNGGNSANGKGYGGGGQWRLPDGWWTPSCLSVLLLGRTSPDEESASMELLSLLSCFFLALLPSSVRASDMSLGVWEVKGGKWTRLVPDPLSGHSFVVAAGNLSFKSWWRWCTRLMLPEGYPDSVGDDYLEYSLWRGVQVVANQISAVLSTQALLYAVGLGKGVIPTAAAVSWVLKDGIGFLSKILLSKFGRHFDVNPKEWRIFADFLEYVAYGIEIFTPTFPHLFVFIGAAAGAGRSAAALIHAATRNCFYAGFALQRNFAEIIVKGEAQAMVSKFVGIILGIVLADYVGSSVKFTLLSFGLVTGVDFYCNFKSYQSLQLRTLNTYRASLVFSEYLLSGQVPLIGEVNDEEPLFPAFPIFNMQRHIDQPRVLSSKARDAAAEICTRLHFGCKLSEIVKNKEDAFVLFNQFRDEGYLLAIHEEKFCVVLKEGSSPQDMLKSLFHVNYLYWLERKMGLESREIVAESKPGARLQISSDYLQQEFSNVNHDGSLRGWIMDGLIARPRPNRIRPGLCGSNPDKQMKY